MPFIIQQPPIMEIPRTRIENTQSVENNNNQNVTSINLDRDLMEHVYVKEKFNSLKHAWEKNTMFSSSLSSIINENNFKRIVEMGPNVVPFIIYNIDKKPSNLVWALNLITGKTLRTNYRITVTEACKIWVKLYKSGSIQL